MALAGSTLGARIKEIRTRRLSVTQPDFAARLRTKRDGDKTPHPQVVSRWERDLVEPSLHYIKQIADLGAVSVEELLDGTNGVGPQA